MHSKWPAISRGVEWTAEQMRDHARVYDANKFLFSECSNLFLVWNMFSIMQCTGRDYWT